MNLHQKLDRLGALAMDAYRKNEVMQSWILETVNEIREALESNPHERATEPRTRVVEPYAMPLPKK